jgi:hypothetical protein
MHDALGDALMVEMGDLLAQDEIFQQRGPAALASTSSGCPQPVCPAGGQYRMRLRLLLEFSAVANGALGWGFLFSWGFLGHDALLGNERHVLLTRIFQAEQRYVFQLPQWENKKGPE